MIFTAVLLCRRRQPQDHYCCCRNIIPCLHGGTFMRAATLKGIAIHTAREAGLTPGPDYQFGWGLLNMEDAAAVITANNTTHLIRENVLNNGGTFSLPVIASGNGTLRATICWTDVKGTVEPESTRFGQHKQKAGK